MWNLNVDIKTNSEIENCSRFAEKWLPIDSANFLFIFVVSVCVCMTTEKHSILFWRPAHDNVMWRNVDDGGGCGGGFIDFK